MPGTVVKLDYTYSIEKGATWGTAIDTAPYGLPIDQLEIKQSSIQHEFPRAYGIRATQEDNYFSEDTLSIPTAKISNMPVTPVILKDLLGGILQKPTAWSPTTSIYTMFANTTYAGAPAFRSNEGYFYTITRNTPESAKDERIASAVPHTLKLSLDVKDNNSVLMADLDFIGNGYARNVTATTTPLVYGLATLYKFSGLGAVKFDSVSIKADFIGFEVEIKNNAKFVNDLPTGEIVLPKYEASGKIKMMGGSAEAELMKTYAQNSAQSTGRQFEIQWGDGTVSSAGELNLSFFCYLTNWSSSYDEGEVIEFDFVGCEGVTASTEYIAYAKFHSA